MSLYIVSIIGVMALCGLLAALTVGIWKRRQSDHVINQLVMGGILDSKRRNEELDIAYEFSLYRGDGTRKKVGQ